MEKQGKVLAVSELAGDHTAREEMENVAMQKQMFMLPEYKFDHVCYELSTSQINESGLIHAFNACRDVLKLQTRPEIGFTVLVTMKWMFVCITTQPYTCNEHGLPVYLDGFSYAGLVSLQNAVPEWPATAGLVKDAHTVLGAFNTSTYYEHVGETTTVS